MGGLAAAAEQIADLSRQATSADACTEALSILKDAVGGDAVMLDVGTTHLHRSVASIGYSDALARAFHEDFVESEWFDMVIGAATPPTISTEPTQSFRRGWFYEENLAPAGFRDGLSCALPTRGPCIAVVHISSRTQGALGPAPQAFIAGVAPLLSGFARAGTWLPPTEVDPGLRRLARAAASAGMPSLRGVWATASGWTRFALQQDSPGDALSVRTSPFTMPHALTPREVEVLTLVAVGMGNREIADHLVVSERTVHSHLGHLLAKTGVRSRTELAVLAVSSNLLMPTETLPMSHSHELKRALGADFR